jgi:DNA-directed RNA polymerase specialized sigma24 family protein
MNFKKRRKEKLKKEFYTIIKGEKHAVSQEVYKAYQKFENKIKYSEHQKNADRIIIDEAKGKITFIKSPEMSFERLLECDVQFPDSRKTDIEDLIEMKMLLDDALDYLPPADRKFIDLHYYKGYRISELANIRQTSLRNMYKTRDRILCTLNELLSK